MADKDYAIEFINAVSQSRLQRTRPLSPAWSEMSAGAVDSSHSRNSAALVTPS